MLVPKLVMSNCTSTNNSKQVSGKPDQVPQCTNGALKLNSSRDVHMIYFFSSRPHAAQEEGMKVLLLVQEYVLATAYMRVYVFVCACACGMLDKW